MSSYKVRRFVGLVVAAGTVSLLSGCPESAIDITESASDPSQDFSVASSYAEPDGSFTLGEFAILFDTTVSDAFARSIPGTRGTFGLVYGSGVWDFDGQWRNGSTDQRLPALTDDDAAAGDLVIIDGSFFGFSAFNPYFNDGQFENLDPGTTYTVAFVKYELRVNGELDAAAAALGQPITQPDELILSPDGTPKGDPTFNIEPFADIFAQADANPFVLGQLTTNASGSVDMDVLIDAFTATGEAVFYQDITGEPADASFDSAIVARSDDVPTSLPRYNYLVLFKGEAATAADVLGLPQALRLQIGTDFLESGEAVNNGYPPFPEQIPADELSGAPGFLGARPKSMQATFGHLEALADGAMYEAWLANPITGSVIPATGTYYRIQLVPIIDDVTGEVIGFEEDTVATVQGTNRFVGGNDEFRHALAVSDATLGGGATDSVGFHTYLMLTIAESPGGAEPAAARPFWLQYTDQNGTPDDLGDDVFFLSGKPSFGYFELANPAASRTYSGEGNGLGGVRFDPNGSVVSVDMRNLSRPPVGYVLAGWLERVDGTTFRMPDVTGPPPDFVDLVDADVQLVENLVTPNGVLDANFRVVTSEAGIDLTEFRRFLITLEPKAGLESRGPILVQVGDLPERAFRQPAASQ